MKKLFKSIPMMLIMSAPLVAQEVQPLPEAKGKEASAVMQKDKKEAALAPYKGIIKALYLAHKSDRFLDGLEKIGVALNDLFLVMLDEAAKAMTDNERGLMHKFIAPVNSFFEDNKGSIRTLMKGDLSPEKQKEMMNMLTQKAASLFLLMPPDALVLFDAAVKDQEIKDLFESGKKQENKRHEKMYQEFENNITSLLKKLLATFPETVEKK